MQQESASWVYLSAIFGLGHKEVSSQCLLQRCVRGKDGTRLSIHQWGLSIPTVGLCAAVREARLWLSLTETGASPVVP